MAPFREMTVPHTPFLRASGPVATPALLIDLDRVDANLRAVLAQCGGDASRWRPHIKTVKSAAVIRRAMAAGLTQFKCATVKELALLLELGVADVLLAFPLTVAHAERVRALAAAHPGTQVSVLVEQAAHLEPLRGSGLGVFLDLNPGMDRSGRDPSDAVATLTLAQAVQDAGCRLRGLHWYDGHLAGVAAEQRDAVAHAGYDRLLQLVQSLEAAGLSIAELVVAGTPAAPSALRYPRWGALRARVQISPGTVLLNDRTSLAQIPDWDLQPAAVVLSSVVSHPRPGRVTCDAGHKALSADAGVPTGVVLGHPDWAPSKPSEEHLPIDLPAGAQPPVGTLLELLPAHICPTVNLYDEALLVRAGELVGRAAIEARGR
jgi:D-serine deaminase-like pyridoxal phosphate-dependent protein